MPPGIMPRVNERRSNWVRALRHNAARVTISMVSAVPIRVRPMKEGARRKNCRLK
ncbi:hypothetical protein D3C76_1863350 [compost metagenome]